MSYIVIDIFTDQQSAEIRAESYRQAGRSNVRLIEKDGITINDCSTEPCLAKHDQVGSPLYIIQSEG